SGEPAEVARERANVRAWTTSDAHGEITALAPDELPCVDRDPRGCELQRRAFSRGVICATAADLLRGIGGRDLRDRARPTSDALGDRDVIRGGSLAHHDSGEIVAIHFGAEANPGEIHLGLALDVRN